ncbi:hypothetical protein NPIL_656111 [Nephila pilipes]|uniref:Uncharacterized protein n=1 Tax=Nephila pilipes TaxID=299642 RepID=A0A8X6PQZ9_NEPPI|nr:hypothetical protein NPIL_656111 [Nephila pilipes]
MFGPLINVEDIRAVDITHQNSTSLNDSEIYLDLLCGSSNKDLISQMAIRHLTYGKLGLLKSIDEGSYVTAFFDFPQTVILEDEDQRASSQVSHQHLLSDVKACCIDLQRQKDAAFPQEQTIRRELPPALTALTLLSDANSPERNRRAILLSKKTKA